MQRRLSIKDQAPDYISEKTVDNKDFLKAHFAIKNRIDSLYVEQNIKRPERVKIMGTEINPELFKD